MYYVLYNPLSNKGETIKYAYKLANKIEKKLDKTHIMSILNILDIHGFVDSLLPQDKIVVIGGDGTIRRLVNAIQNIHLKNDIFFTKAGTGNDFYRSVKKGSFKFININNYIKILPTVILPEHNVYEKYMNGSGVGLDAYVCYKVNNSGGKNNKFNYLGKTLSGFIEGKKIKEVTIDCDGQENTYKNVWFCSVMNSKFQGGGMKFAPKASRLESDLYLVLVKKMSKLGLFLTMPLIYLGWHGILKNVSITKITRYIDIKTSEATYAQMDGDTFYPTYNMRVETYNYNKEAK
ncbi:MAG: hypothetical protein LBV51_03895 [Acholeplasmatales bacterium]|jgi:diacylglycerol kinase family enzyme|nr:hypothetical protein [Acholeplasmatales bacterium]